MNLREKILAANLALSHAARASAPAILCSFGKDSMVVLDLARRHQLRTVLWLDDLDEVTDRPFIDRVCDQYQLTLVPLAPGRAMFMVVQDQPLFLSFMFVNDRVTTCVPTNMAPFLGEGEPYACVDEELRSSRGTPQMTLPVDHVISGFKLSDVQSKGCLTFVNLLSPHAQSSYLAHLTQHGVHSELAPGLPLTSPLLHWTDADVWHYLDAYNVPWSPRVYDRPSGAHLGTRRPTERTWCYRCHDPREAALVFCPRVRQSVLNLSAWTHDTDLRLEALARTHVMTPAHQQELSHG